MFAKVLFPTDFSEYSLSVLSCVADIPKIREIVLLHIIDATHFSRQGWTHAAHIANAKLIMAEKQESLEKTGLLVKTRIEVIKEGTIYAEINHIADVETVSMIVMGARGKSFTEQLLGSVSTDMLHHATRPLLLMKFRSKTGPEGIVYEKYCPRLFSNVLVPTDFSQPSEESLAFVKRIEGVGEITLLNVVKEDGASHDIDAAVNASREKLAPIRDDLIRAGITATDHVRVGYPPEEIISAAESDDVSLIAMGSRGEGWVQKIEELLIGSTTSAVARRARRPILVIRSS
jgi:nucleotide-binding universal stress UspA family protein